MSRTNCAFESNALGYLADEEALLKFVHAWESGTLPGAEWTHPAHVAVIAHYAFEHPSDEAFRRMKSGILHYAAARGKVYGPNQGYHETVTRFWTILIGNFVRARKSSRLEAARAAVAEFGNQRDRYRAYYSYDLITDARSRKQWVQPDLQPLETIP